MTDPNEVIALRHRIEVLEAQLRDCNDKPGYEELRSHAYEVVKANGEQAFRIRDLELALDKAQGYAARLRAVVEEVEWVDQYDPFCPWCLRDACDGHAADCPRQAALAQTDARRAAEAAEAMERR